MKIKISDTFAVEYLNGYYVVLTHKLQPPEHKDAGDTKYTNHKTYAKIGGALGYLKESGISVEFIRDTFDKSYKDNCIKRKGVCGNGL